MAEVGAGQVVRRSPLGRTDSGAPRRGRARRRRTGSCSPSCGAAAAREERSQSRRPARLRIAALSRSAAVAGIWKAVLPGYADTTRGCVCSPVLEGLDEARAKVPVEVDARAPLKDGLLINPAGGAAKHTTQRQPCFVTSTSRFLPGAERNAGVGEGSCTDPAPERDVLLVMIAAAVPVENVRVRLADLQDPLREGDRARVAHVAPAGVEGHDGLRAR